MIKYTCPIHQTELVLREGVSKKNGKEYSFWGCTDKTDGQFCAHTVSNTPQGLSVRVSPQPGQSTPSENTALLKSILEEVVKIREIVFQNAPPIINKTSVNDAELPFRIWTHTLLN
jgi:hypothetical protein